MRARLKDAIFITPFVTVFRMALSIGLVMAMTP
jgi:hypothetical protein